MLFFVHCCVFVVAKLLSLGGRTRGQSYEPNLRSCGAAVWDYTPKGLFGLLSTSRLKVMPCQLEGLGAAPHLLLPLHRSTIQAILVHCSACLFNIFVKNCSKLTSRTNKASEIIGLPSRSSEEPTRRREETSCTMAPTPASLCSVESVYLEV